MTDEPLPLQHVARPVPPWRTADPLTECGLAITFSGVLSRGEFVTKIRQQGKVRGAMTTCMTCWNTAQNWPTWDQDPVKMVSRECSPFDARKTETIRLELRAIASLVDAHREEFDGLLAGLSQTVSMDDLRRRRARRGRGGS